MDGFEFLIHQRLSLHRLFAFVMPAPSIAHQVNDHVFAISHAVVRSQMSGKYDRLWVIAVDVQNRRLNQFRDLGAVFSGARIFLAIEW